MQCIQIAMESNDIIITFRGCLFIVVGYGYDDDDADDDNYLSCIRPSLYVYPYDIKTVVLHPTEVIH